jgi:hypothetical protein
MNIYVSNKIIDIGIKYKHRYDNMQKVLKEFEIKMVSMEEKYRHDLLETQEKMITNQDIELYLKRKKKNDENEMQKEMQDAMCRLFDEYRESFWTGPNSKKHTIDPQYWTNTIKNTFPEQQIYATLVYGAEQYNNMNITLIQDKVNIISRMLEYYERVSDSPIYTSTFFEGYFRTIPCTFCGTKYTPWKVEHIIHKHRIYVKITCSNFSIKYIDPSICPIYLYKKGNQYMWNNDGAIMLLDALPND